MSTSEGNCKCSFIQGVKDDAGYHIQHDNFVEDTFNVKKPNEEVREFIPSEKGLYYCDSSHLFEQQPRNGNQVQSVKEMKYKLIIPS